MRHFNDNSIEIGYVNILESTQWKVFGIALTTQWRVCTNGLERTTNQANSSCFYFRILWVLMERPWFFSKSFNVETSGALQKPKGMIHKENKVLKLIFMNLWSRNNLDKLDWLTHQDLYYILGKSRHTCFYIIIDAFTKSFETVLQISRKLVSGIFLLFLFLTNIKNPSNYKQTKGKFIHYIIHGSRMI